MIGPRQAEALTGPVKLRCAADAGQWFADLIEALGQGFHPDTEFADYRELDGSASFTLARAIKLDALMEQAFRVCQEENVDPYSLALRALEEKGGT